MFTSDKDVNEFICTNAIGNSIKVKWLDSSSLYINTIAIFKTLEQESEETISV